MLYLIKLLFYTREKTLSNNFVTTYSRRPWVVWVMGFGTSSLMSALVIESLASSCWYRRRRNESWFFDKMV